MPDDNLPLVLIPPHLSDEAACAMLDFLHELTVVFENYYGAHIRQHTFPAELTPDDRQQDLFQETDPPF